MFRNALRPLARSASASARSMSTRPAPAGTSYRTAVIAATTVVIGGLAYSAERRKLLLNSATGSGDKSVRETVLATNDLKTNIHKREDEVPSTVTDKAEEAAQSQNTASQGAFNEETGEINWDCPCLGGMADGPCGEQFRAAFSCFVYSEAEPKGLDCVEKFKAMQDCFREHPDIYGEEIDDDDAEVEGSPLPADHPEGSKVPAAPTDAHPQDNAAMHVSPDATPSKGPSKYA